MTLFQNFTITFGLNFSFLKTLLQCHYVRNPWNGGTSSPSPVSLTAQNQVALGITKFPK